MTAAVVNRSKGTALLMEIATVYTAMPLVKNIDISGLKGESMDTVTLDGPVGKTKGATGYVEPASIKWDMFLDPAQTVHAAYASFVKAPPATPVNFKVTYTDAGPTSEIYSCVTGGIDKKAAPAEGLNASCEVQTSGLPT